MKNFVTCHCHQASLDTASTPEAFAAKEMELETGFLTVTDHGTLNAARRVFDLGKKKKLTPIIGLEAYLRDDDCPILTSAGVPKARRWRNNEDPDETEVISEEAYAKLGTEKAKLYQPEFGFWDYAKYFHLTMHFLDEEAYETGVRLLSKADARAERTAASASRSSPGPIWRSWAEERHHDQLVPGGRGAAAPARSRQSGASPPPTTRSSGASASPVTSTSRSSLTSATRTGTAPATWSSRTAAANA
jgi:DNA polymerase III alpha subunit